MNLETLYANGQLAALTQYKLSFLAPHPTVAGSAVLGAKSAPKTTVGQGMQPPTTPFQLSQVFDAHEQGETRTEPRRKLSADICTTCRKAKHYGPCGKPRPIPAKQADFNFGMTGDDPSCTDQPATGPNYHSATSDTSLARARDGRPAGEQASTAFADLFRHQGITNLADQPGQTASGFDKTAHKLSAFMLPDRGLHSMHTPSGSSVNPYEEQRTRMSPPVGWGDESEQRIERAFNQVDQAADSTCVEGGAGSPATGPAVLG